MDWSLAPRLYRPGYEDLDEDEFRYDFKRRAWPYLAGAAREPATDWEWYFLMQHHGLPTRLIDWTESALVALYFAVRDRDGENDAVVWMLNPWKLNLKVAMKGEKILLAGTKPTQAYLREPFSGGTLPRQPLALEPMLNSRRITAQRGVFTLHGTTRKALDRYSALKPHLVKIVIVQGATADLKEQLRVAGVTETTVFPELTALCREIEEFWNC